MPPTPVNKACGWTDTDTKAGSSLASAKFPVEAGMTYEVRFWGAHRFRFRGAAVYMQVS